MSLFSDRRTNYVSSRESLWAIKVPWVGTDGRRTCYVVQPQTYFIGSDYRRGQCSERPYNQRGFICQNLGSITSQESQKSITSVTKENYGSLTEDYYCKEFSPERFAPYHRRVHKNFRTCRRRPLSTVHPLLLEYFPKECHHGQGVYVKSKVRSTLFMSLVEGRLGILYP